MILKITGREPLTVSHIVLDYNGTIAVDGALIEGIKEQILKLRGGQ